MERSDASRTVATATIVIGGTLCVAAVRNCLTPEPELRAEWPESIKQLDMVVHTVISSCQSLAAGKKFDVFSIRAWLGTNAP